MLSEIQLAISSISGAKALAEGLIAERDASKLALATADLLGKLIDAQTAVLSLQAGQAMLQDELSRLKNENFELEKRCAAVVEKREELADYKLTGLAHGATYVLSREPDEQGFRHPPYLCATCAEQGKKSVLSFQGGTPKSPGRKLVCPASAMHTLTLPRGGWTLENLGRSEHRANS